MDPGYRIHSTDYARPTAQSPSGFVTKLRKHLRTRRLNKIQLAPQNRLLVLSFSDEHSFHLVFEFFAGGNMILLDKDLKILSLQRVVSASDTKTRCAVGEYYPLMDYLNAKDTTPNNFTNELIESWLKSENDNGDEDDEQENSNVEQNALQQDTERKPTPQKKKKALSLKKLLFVKTPGIATGIIEAALLSKDINPDMKTTELNTKESISSSLESISKAMNEAKNKSDELVATTPITGYILGKLNPKFDNNDSTDKGTQETVVEAPEVSSIDPHNIEYLYEEFQPFKPKIPDTEPEKYKLIETKSYSQAVDIYFSTIEATKLALRTAHQEQVAEKRLNAAKSEKDKRVQGLTEVQEKSETLGTVLETNSHLVEEAINAVKGLLKQGMDWTDIEKLIQVEKSRNNPVAEIIHLPLNLIKNKISVILPEPGQEEEEEDDDDSTDTESVSSSSTSQSTKKVKIEIDLSMSAWANASSYFDVKKSAAAKQERTVKQADHAYKSAEKKIKKDLHQALEKEKNQQTMHSIRDPFWFEKFFWFLSSDGYLVLGGRDRMQNELLFRRHFKQNDIFVHSDIENTCVVIIKNHISGSNSVVPPGTLSQAGILCLSSSSKVWESKMTPSAWWATREKIPKISHGDIVTTDRIVVKGDGKNYLPPSQMDMGFGFLWLVSDESKENYKKNIPSGLVSAPGEETSQEQGVVNESNDGREAKYNEGNVVTEENEEEEGENSSDDEEFPDTQIPEEEEVQEQEQGTETVPEHEQEQTSGILTDEESSLPADNNNNLSANNRHDSKKNGTAENFEKDSSTVQDIEKTLDNLKVSKTAVNTNKDKKTSSNGDQKAPKVRGKKGKMKKIATKYAHQDEEDKQRHMELLGTTKGLERAKAQAEEEKRKKEEYERQRKEKERRRKEAEMKKLQEEEHDETPETVFPFDTLVPKVVPGDTPLFAVPIFGPWSALQKLKYKVKLQPGSTKKGKAVREILHHFSNQKTDPEEQDPDIPWQSEIDLFGALKEADLLLPIAVSKVKLMTSGGNNTAAGKKQKNSSSKSGSGGGSKNSSNKSNKKKK